MKKIFANYCHSELVSESLKHKTLKQFQHNRKLTAFTLAEVLITLTIIGVIAALTIPNLMQKWSDHADVVKVKAVYSMLNNAWTMCLKENGPVFEWDWPSPITPLTYTNDSQTDYMAKKIYSYMKIEKYCGLNNCFSTGSDSYKSLNHLPWGSSFYVDRIYRGKAILANGMYVTIDKQRFDANGNAYDTFVRVDINGGKGPNRYGYDVFFFVLRQNNVLYLSDKRFCPFGNGAQSYSHMDGNSCAYWVLRKGNMDYKYRDVSAEW